MGGPDRVAKYLHNRGKLDARQRVDRLFDSGTFREIGELVGGTDDTPADAFVAGHGLVDGRPVLVGVEDFSVMGGSIGAGNTSKRYRIAELAEREQVPLVTMLEGAGHRLTDTGGGRAPGDLQAYADLSGQVPMACLVLGATAGHGALAAPLSDFVVMTDAGAMFTGGPPLVAAATGEQVTKEELGGPDVAVHTSGVAHNLVATDAEAIDLARLWLGYLPSNRSGAPPHRDSGDTGPREVDELLDIIAPNHRVAYDIGDVIETIADDGQFLEIQPSWGAAIVCGFMHLGGRSVAVIANNPGYRAGAIDAEAAIKATDFIESVANFGQPVVYLIDNPGVLAGTAAERSGILRWGAQMYRAGRNLSNPKIAVTLRKAFGFGSTVMGHNPFDHQTMTFALPSATTSAMPARAGGQSAGLDAETQQEVEAAQRSGPWRMANKLSVDQVIAPGELRNALLGALELTQSR